MFNSSNSITKLQGEEWYLHLVEECKAILVERFYNSNLEAVTAYGEIGERIVSDVNYKKWGKGNRKFNNDLFKDIGLGERTGYYCLQFYERKLQEPITNGTYKDVCTAVQTIYGKNLTWNKVRAELPEKEEENEPLTPIEGKYHVIVIDPPWPYGTEYDAETRRVASPYPEKSIEELKEFDIKADDNSIIWLWTTHKFLPDAFELLKTWGFEYKANFVWDKQKMGMGAWLRMQVEFCLLGIKGRPQWNLTNQRDILSVSRREHSRKPDEFYEIVKKLTPDMKRIDIFSREKRDGFEQYGNEPDKF